MEHLYKRKPNLLFFWFLLPFLLYTGYAVGKLEGEEISISNLQEITLYSLTHPLKFNLGTNKYADRFMDAYGREMIEPEMLRMIAAMEMIGK